MALFFRPIQDVPEQTGRFDFHRLVRGQTLTDLTVHLLRVDVISHFSNNDLRSGTVFTSFSSLLKIVSWAPAMVTTIDLLFRLKTGSKRAHEAQ